MRERPDAVIYCMGLAVIASSRSTCRVPVGVVITDEEFVILATGYNGAPSGEPHCIDEGCELDERGHCKRVIHAERNGLGFLRIRGYQNAFYLFSTVFSCLECMNEIIQTKKAVKANTVRLYYMRSLFNIEEYKSHPGDVELTIKKAMRAGIELIQVDEKEVRKFLRSFLKEFFKK